MMVIKGGVVGENNGDFYTNEILLYAVKEKEIDTGIEDLGKTGLEKLPSALQQNVSVCIHVCACKGLIKKRYPCRPLDRA